jgi:hypothetical protein
MKKHCLWLFAFVLLFACNKEEQAVDPTIELVDQDGIYDIHRWK